MGSFHLVCLRPPKPPAFAPQPAAVPQSAEAQPEVEVKKASGSESSIIDGDGTESIARRPSCTVSTDKDTLIRGEVVSVTVNSIGRDVVAVLDGVPYGPSSPLVLSPIKTQTFTATVTNGAGSSSCTKTVNVTVPIPKCSLVASQSTIDQGGQVTITPTVTGFADGFTLDDVESSQSLGKQFTLMQTKVFRGIARNEAGTSECSVAVNVRIPNAPNCTIAFNPTTIRIESSATATVSLSGVYRTLTVRNMDVTSSITANAYSTTVTPVAGANRANFSETLNATVTGPGGSNTCAGVLPVQVPATPTCTITLSRQTATVGNNVTVSLASSSTDIKSASFNGATVTLPYSQTFVAVLGRRDFSGVVQNFGPNAAGTCTNSLMVGPPPGIMYAWGANSYGQSALQNSGGAVNIPMPTLVDATGGWSSLAAGNHHSLGIKNGQLFSWGANYTGQLGSGESASTSRNTPLQIGSFNDWTTVSADSASFGIRAGILYGWGNNQFGQIGNGTTATLFVPTQIGTFSDCTRVDAGVEHTVAICGGRLYAWGENQHGQLGDGTTIDKTTPVQIGTLSDWLEVSAGGHHTIGIRGSGELYFWGQELASNTFPTTQYNSPRRVGTLSDWRTISAGFHHSLAIRATGQLYVFGFNWFTQHGLGDGTLNSYVNPIQLGTSNTWTAISAGASRSMGINNGQLYVWGENTSYELGTGNTINLLTPVQVGSVGGWSTLSQGSNTRHSMGAKN